jgi:alpha-tubulin suppressor-like RCC1 family protein
MRFIEIPALITEDIEDPSIVEITEPITVSISGTTMTIDGGSKVSGEASVTLTGDVTVNAFTLQNVKQPSIHKISVKTNRKGNFKYVPNDTVTASSVSTTTKTGSDFEILLITTTGGETYVDFDMADYVSPALYTSNALTGFDISELTSTYGATAKLYKPDGTLLTTVTSATTGNGVNFGYTESTPQDVTYTLEVEDDLGRTSRYDLPRKWISYAMETNSTPGFEKIALAGNEYTSTTIVPNLTSTSKVRVHKTGNHGYLGINFKIQGRNTTNGAWVDIDDTGENENDDESKEFLAFGDYLYHRVWVKPTAKATTTVSSSNVVTLTLSNLTEENVTTSFTGVDPFDLNESTNTYVFEETTKVGTIPFTVTLGTETYTNAVTATTEEVSTVPNTDMTAAGPNKLHDIQLSQTGGYMSEASGNGKYIAYNKTNDSVVYILKGDPVSGYADYNTITYSQDSTSPLVGSMTYDGKYIIIARRGTNSNHYEIWKHDESAETYTKLSQTVQTIGTSANPHKPAFVPAESNYNFAISGGNSNNGQDFSVQLYKHNAGTDTWTAQTIISNPRPGTVQGTVDNRSMYAKSFTKDGKYLMFGNTSTYGGYDVFNVDFDENTVTHAGNWVNNGDIGHSGAITSDGKYILLFDDDSNSRKIFKNNDAGDWSSSTDVTSDFTFEDTDNDQGYGICFFGEHSEYFVSTGASGGAVRVYRWYPKKEVTLTFSNPTLTLTGQNVTISSAKLYRDDVLFHTYGTETKVVLRSDQTGTYQAIVNDVYYSNRITPDFTTTRSVSAPQLEFDGYNRLNLSNSTPTSTTLGLPDGTTRDLTTQSNVYIYETGTYTANVQTSDTFAYLSNVVTSQPSQNSADVGPTFTFDGYNRLNLSNLTQTSSTLKYGSITYDTNTASNVYVTDTGEYKLEARDANTFVMSNVYVGAVSQHPSDVVPSLTFDGYNKLTIENVSFSANEWPPTDGTVTSGSLGQTSTWSISGASYGNGTYVATSSVGIHAWNTYAVFDKNLNVDSWHTSSGNTTGTLKIQLPESIVLGSYSLYHRNIGDVEMGPKDWTIEGSNNDSTWTTIDTQTAQDMSTFGSAANDYIRTYTVSGNTTKYSYYRIVVTANNGNVNYLSIGEWKMFTPLPDNTVTIKKDGAAFATTTSNTVYIRNAGTYTAEVKGSGAYVTEVSKVVSGDITEFPNYVNATSFYYGGGVVDNTGKLYTWGHDGYGDSGRGASDRVPTHLSSISDPVSNVWRGTPGYTMAAKTSTDKWYMWGRNTYSGVLGNTTNTGNVTVPEDVTAKVTTYFGDQTVSANKIIKMAMGEHHAVALTAGGKVWSWGGDATYYATGTGTNDNTVLVTPVQLNRSPPISGQTGYEITNTNSAVSTLKIRANGSIFTFNSQTCWYYDRLAGSNNTWYTQQLGYVPSTNTFIEASISGNPDQVYHNKTSSNVTKGSITVPPEGILLSNDPGSWNGAALFANPFTSTSDPLMTGITNVEAVYHGTAALDSSGNVWFWGGASTSMQYAYPTKLLDSSSIPGIVGLRATNKYSLFTWKSDGTFYTRGAGTYGQLATGSETDQYASWQTVTTLQGKTIKKVFGGNENMFVWTDDGVYGVGRGNNYKLGNGSTSNRSTFHKSNTLSALSIKEIDFGHATGLVLTTDGKGYMWGEDASNSMANALSGHQSGAAEATSISALSLVHIPSPSITYDGKNKLTVGGTNYADTATVSDPNGSIHEIGTAKTMYVKDIGDYVFKISGTDKYVESNVYVSSVDLAGAPTKPIDFDGYNKLTLIDAGSNVSANVTYFSNTYELGSANVLYINGAGTYDLEMSGSNVFALSSNVVGTVSQQHPTDVVPSLTFDNYNKLTLENFTTSESDTRTATLTDPNGNTYSLGQTQNDIYIEDTGEYILEVTNSDQSAVVKTNVGTIDNIGPTYTPGIQWSFNNTLAPTIDDTQIDYNTTSLVNASVSTNSALVTRHTISNIGTTQYATKGGHTALRIGASYAHYLGKAQHIEVLDGTDGSNMWKDSKNMFMSEWTVEISVYFDGSVPTSTGTILGYYASGANEILQIIGSRFVAGFWYTEGGTTPNQAEYHMDKTLSANTWYDVKIVNIPYGSGWKMKCYINDEFVEGYDIGNGIKIGSTTENSVRTRDTLDHVDENESWMMIGRRYGDITNSPVECYIRNLKFYPGNIVESFASPPSLTFDGYNKLSIENFTPTSTTLRFGSNTYDIGTASNVYIEDAGTYKVETGDANTFALVSNVVGALDSDPKYFTIFPSSITLGGWWGTNWSGSNYSKTSNTPTKIVYDLAGGVTAVLNGSQYGITFNATTTGIELDLNATGQADTPYTFTSPTITTAVTSGIITVGQTISIKALNGDEEATFTVPDFGYNIVPSLTYDTSNKLSIENITPTSTILTDPNGSSFDIGTATDVYIRDSGTYSIASKYANTFVLASNTVTGTPTGTTYVYDSNTFTTPSQTYDTTKTITVSNVPSHLSNVVGKIYKGSTAYTIHATTSSSNVIIENTGTYVSVFTTATQAFLTNAIDATQPTTTSDDNTIEDVAPSTSVDITLAFHYAGFVATDYNSAYATKEAAAANGFVYADTPDGTYSWGTLTVTSNTTSNTQYTWAISGTGIVDYLVVAGGGAGGNDRAGGGGAGGYRTSVSGDLSGGSTSSETPLSISSGTYSIIVGNGGQWGGETGDTSPGPNGNDSVFHTITSLGGGGGASEHAAPSSGGSGGGGAYYHSSIGNNGTAGQGTSGASGYENFPSERRSGGGGGASSAANLKDGGDGLSSTITGTPVIRGGGGGAGDNRDTIGTQGPGSGGSGGGGDGGLGAGGTGSNGVAHTGGGGGGGGVGNDPSQGGDGGSGIVIIKYTGTITSLSGSTAVPTETTTDAPSVTLDATDTTVTDPTLDLDFTTTLPRTLKRYNGVTNSSIGARFNRRESNKKRIEKSISIPTSFSAELTANNASSPTTLTVTVANSKFVINGDETPTLGFIRGETYTFDQSDASNSGHPLVLATSEDGATQYTTGWTTTPSSPDYVPGVSGAQGTFIVPYDVPDTIYYKCNVHSNMGGEINTTFGNAFSLGDFTVAANTHVSGEYTLATNYDGTTSNLYVNGYLITQTTPSPAISAGVKDFILGKEFDGYVKNFKFWNYAKRFRPPGIYPQSLPSLDSTSLFHTYLYTWRKTEGTLEVYDIKVNDGSDNQGQWWSDVSNDPAYYHAIAVDKVTNIWEDYGSSHPFEDPVENNDGTILVTDGPDGSYPNLYKFTKPTDASWIE